MVCVHKECKWDIFCLMNTYKYFNMEVRYWTNNVKQEYVNIYYWEVDLSKPDLDGQC